MAIFKNQDLLTLTLETGIDVSAASAAAVLYKKPSGTTGQWVASVAGTTVTYAVGPSDLDEAGVWKVQPKVTIAGEIGYGEIKPMTVSDRIL
jgi:hypothetical protein